MPDMEKVIKGLHDIGGFIAGRVGFEQALNFLRTIDDAIDLLKEQQQQIWELEDQVEYLTDKQKKKFLVDSDGKITPLPDVVRCKDCKWRGTNACFCKARDDVRDDWFCSEGERKEGR